MKNQIERAEPNEFKEAAYRLENTIRLLRTEQKAAIEALRRYGKHLTGCACFNEFDEKACDCGFGKYEVGERAEPSRGAPEAAEHEPDAFEAAWLDYNKAGVAGGWEKVAFVGGFGRGFKAGRETGHVVLLEALRSTMQSLDDWLCDDTISDETQSEMLTLEDEIEKLLRKFEAEAAIQQAERT